MTPIDYDAEFAKVLAEVPWEIVIGFTITVMTAGAGVIFGKAAIIKGFKQLRGFFAKA